MKLFLPMFLMSIFLCSCIRKQLEYVGNGNSKPNIILIYADDLGKGLLSHEGQTIIQTPHIDFLAENGIRFTNAHACMLCAPARASLISGKHDCHEPGFEVTNGGYYLNVYDDEIPYEVVQNAIDRSLTKPKSNEIFIGQVAQAAGYVTGQIGKLDWGFSATHQTLKRHGWDNYFGYLDHVRAHGFYPPFLFGNGKKIDISGNILKNCGKSIENETQAAYDERWNMEGKEQYAQTIFMDSLKSFISQNRDTSFFLYFPTQLPHGPVAIPAVHQDFADRDDLTQIEKEYASMVKLLDTNVGDIVAFLKEMSIYDNTIIIFTSDNGHEIYYTQEGRTLKPYTNMTTGKRFDNLTDKYYSETSGDVFDGNKGRAGMKRSNLEGGIEVPLIFHWPEKIQGKQTSHRLVSNYDLKSTLAEIVNYDGDLDGDGISFYNTILDSKDMSNEQEYLVFSSFEGPTLITKEGWKLRTFLKDNVFELYFLPEDYREERDLSREHPERLEELKSKLLSECDGDFDYGLWKNSELIDITIP